MKEKSFWELSKENRALLLGVVALGFGVVGILLQWIFHANLLFMSKLGAERKAYVIAAFSVLASLPYAFSAFCATFAFLSAPKGRKTMRDCAALFLAVFALVLSVAGVALYVLGFFI